MDVGGSLGQRADKSHWNRLGFHFEKFDSISGEGDGDVGHQPNTPKWHSFEGQTEFFIPFTSCIHY